MLPDGEPDARKKAGDEVDALREEMLNRAFDTALAIARRDVFPFLKKRRYSLMSLNGDFWVRNRNGNTVHQDSFTAENATKRTVTEEFRRVMGILNTPLPTGTNEQSLGSLLDVYPERKEKKHGDS